MHLLAISGSLRARSANTEVLRALAAIAAPRHAVPLYEGLGTLPHFDPDLDDEGAIAPPPVARLRDLVTKADALVICRPEYAHGVPGSLKNALDWLVSSPAMVGKPVLLINASSRSSHAVSSLAETLRTMSAVLVTEQPVLVPIDGRRLDAAQITEDPALASILRGALDSLATAIDP